MPQDTLDPTMPRQTGLRIDCEERLMPAGLTWRITVQRHQDGKDWKTVWVGPWEGVMMDMLATLYESAAEAFMFGEPKQLVRTCGRVHREAVRHRASHSF